MDNQGIVPTLEYGRGGSYGYGCDGGMGMGNGFMGIFAIFAIIALLGGGNIFGGRNAGTLDQSSVLEAVNLSNGQQTAQLEAAANQRENCSQFTATNANISGGFANLSRDLCSQSFGIVNTITNGNADIKDRLVSMAAQNAQCCCDQIRAIDGVNFNISQSTAAINANTVAQTQKILDVLCQDKIAAQAARIQQLELNQALCGVVRYPTQATYSVGYPFNGFGYGYGFNNGGCGI